MTNAQINTGFLNSVTPQMKSAILSNIAAHYGINNEAAYAEVTGPEAESIMDYITGTERSAISLIFNGFLAGVKVR